MRRGTMRVDGLLLRGFWTGWIMACFALLPFPARAQVPMEPPERDLTHLADWSVPTTCISHAELTQKLRAALSGVVLPEGRRLRGRAIEGKEGWTIVIEVSDQGEFTGRRILRLASGDCRDHDESIVLVAALLLEHGPPDVDEPLPEELSVAPPGPDVPESPPPAEDTRPTPSRPGLPHSVRVRALLSVELPFGWTPRIGPGVRLGVGFSPLRALWVDVLGTWIPPTEVARGSGKLRTLGARARLRGCGAARLGSLWGVQACATAGWRGLAGEGSGVTEGGSAFFSTAEMGAEVGARATISDWLALTVEADTVVALRRGTFVFDILMDPAEQLHLHTTARVLPSVSLGLLGTF